MNLSTTDSRSTWGKIDFCLCTLILPACFLLSIFKEPAYNNVIIILSFLLLARILFLGGDKISLNKGDKLIILAIAAALLVMIYAADLMASQGQTYTHMEELERLFAAFFIGTYIYHHDRKAFQTAMQIIAWLIFVSAVISSIRFAMRLSQIPGVFDSVFSAERYLRDYRHMMTSVYRHHIPAGTAFVIGIALPLLRKHRVLDYVLKLAYLPALFFSYPRSAWIAFAVLVSIILYEEDRRRHNGKLSRLWWVIMAVLIIGMLLVLWYLTHQRGDSFGSSNGRIRYWKYLTFVLYRRLPVFSKLFGNGFYTSIIMDQTPVAMKGFPAVDNAYFTILYEQGLVGIGTVILFLLRALRRIWKRRHRDVCSSVYCGVRCRILL